MRIEDFIALIVYGAAKDVPQLKDGLSHDLNGIAAVTTDGKTAIMRQHIILDLRQNDVDQVPIVIAVTDHGEILVRIDFFQQTPNVRHLITINGEIGAHNTMFCRQSAVGHLVILCTASVIMLQPEDSWDCGSVKEAQAERSRTLGSAFYALLAAH